MGLPSARKDDEVEEVTTDPTTGAAPTGAAPTGAAEDPTDEADPESGPAAGPRPFSRFSS
ncbi:MAG: hypothetical protein WKF80_01695 [Thermomicrobiales bacterium]